MRPLSPPSRSTLQAPQHGHYVLTELCPFWWVWNPGLKSPVAADWLNMGKSRSSIFCLSPKILQCLPARGFQLNSRFPDRGNFDHEILEPSSSWTPLCFFAFVQGIFAGSGWKEGQVLFTSFSWLYFSFLASVQTRLRVKAQDGCHSTANPGPSIWRLLSGSQQYLFCGI